VSRTTTRSNSFKHRETKSVACSDCTIKEVGRTADHGVRPRRAHCAIDSSLGSLGPSFPKTGLATVLHAPAQLCQSLLLIAHTQLQAGSAHGSMSRPIQRTRLSNAPVVRLRLVVDFNYERSGISTETAESG
jgi:hypothetical protein